MKTYNLWECINPKVVLQKAARGASYDLEFDSETYLGESKQIRAKSLDGAIAQVKKKYPGRYIELVEARG